MLAAKAAVSRGGERPRARGARAMRRGAGAVLVRVAAQGGERGRERGIERRGGSARLEVRLGLGPKGLRGSRPAWLMGSLSL